MKLKDLLNVNEVLRIALPCLTMSLFFSSCSNDELPEISNQTTDTSGLTFTATVPTASGEYLTRLGIGDNSVTTDAKDLEQFVWLEGDKVTFYFKAIKDGADKKMEYKAINISEDLKSCDMTPVDGSATIVDGFYKVYALTPSSNDNFLTGGINGTKIDLRNQAYSDEEGNHGYLRNYMYNYATTVVQIVGNKIVSGSTKMPYRNITSLLRFHVTNSTGAKVTVQNISISYPGNQLFDQGVFTPADPIGVHSITTAGTATKNTMSMTADKVLSADGDYFDAYMVVFPTVGFTAPYPADRVIVKVDYLDKDGGSQSRVWDLAINTGAFKHGTDNSYLTFKANERHYLGLGLDEKQEEPVDPYLPEIVNVAGVDYTTIVVGNLHLIPHVAKHPTLTYGTGIYSNHVLNPTLGDMSTNPCPPSYRYMRMGDYNDLSLEDRADFIARSGLPDYYESKGLGKVVIAGGAVCQMQRPTDDGRYLDVEWRMTYMMADLRDVHATTAGNSGQLVPVMCVKAIN